MRIISLLLALSAALPLTSGAAMKASYDYDGDNIGDFAVYHRDAGDFYIRRSSNGSLYFQPYGWGETIPVCGDFDGDNRADVAVYHRKSGTWYILQSSNGQQRIKQFGFAGTQPVPGDYNNDGITDLALYERKTGIWYFLLSPGETFSSFQWGWADAQPCPADYDGDGDTDAAVYHSEGGDFYIRNNNGTQRFVPFGWSMVQPKPGDYNGDGIDDICVYDPMLADWYLLLSPSGTFVKQQYGWEQANAVPGDYDGDNITDLCVYHPDGGNWYILRSTSSSQVVIPWGWSEGRAVKSWAFGAPEDVRVMCIGDSITYGRGSALNDPRTGYPVRLQRRLRAAFGGDWICKNEGLPGETTFGGVARMDFELNQNNPDISIVMEGTNDMGRDEIGFSSTRANLTGMVNMSLARGTATIISTIPPVTTTAFRNRDAQQNRIVAFNPNIYGIGAETGATVAPVFEAITAVPNWQNTLIEPVAANHPNDAGYDILVDVFFDAIEQFLLDGDVY